MTPPLVVVYWDDAHGSNPRWEEEIEPGQRPQKPSPIVTVGWVMNHDDAGITIACEQTSATTYRGNTFVPKECIYVVKTVRKGSFWKRPERPCPVHDEPGAGEPPRQSD